MTAKHTLEKIVYNSQFNSSDLAWEFQAKAAGFIENELGKVIDEVCTKLDRKGSIIKVNKLEFDLGKFQYLNSEKEIIEKLREEVYNSLYKIISQLSFNPSEKGQIIAEEVLESQLLKMFIEKGYYSSHTYNQISFSLQKSLHENLNNNAESFIRWLKIKARKENIRRRLIYQFSDKQIIEIIDHVDPENSKFIAEHTLALRHKHAIERLHNLSESNFRNLSWEVILAYIFSEAGSYFNRKTFVKYTLQKIALRFRINFGSLLQTFSGSVSELMRRKGINPEFPKLILELKTEFENTKQIDIQEENTAEYKATLLKELKLVLQGKKSELEEKIFIDLLNFHFKDALKLIKQYLNHSQSIENCLNGFSIEQLKLLVQKLDSSEYPLIIFGMERFDKVVSNYLPGAMNADKQKELWVTTVAALLLSIRGPQLIKQLIWELSVSISIRCLNLLKLLSSQKEYQGMDSQVGHKFLLCVNQQISEVEVGLQKIDLPDISVVRLLDAYYIYDLLMLHVFKKDGKHIFREVKNTVPTHELLSKLESLNPTLLQNFLLLFRDRNKVKQLLFNADTSFISELIVFIFKTFGSDDTTKKVQLQRLLLSFYPVKQEADFFLGFIPKLIKSPNLALSELSEKVQQEIELKVSIKPKKEMKFWELKTNLLSYLLSEKPGDNNVLIYEGNWKKIVTQYPDRIFELIESIIYNPTVFNSFIKTSNPKLLLQIIKIMPVSDYKRNFLLGFIASFELHSSSNYEDERQSLWFIVFQSAIEKSSKKDVDFAHELLIDSTNRLSELPLQRKAIQALRKSVKGLNSMDREKTLAVIQDVEDKLAELTHNLQVPFDNKEFNFTTDTELLKGIINSTHKLKEIIKKLPISDYKRNFLLVFIDTFDRHIPSNYKDERQSLWLLVLQLVIEKNSKRDVDFVQELLIGSAYRLSGLSVQKKAMQVLRKSARGFNSMEREKTLAVIQDVEDRISELTHDVKIPVENKKSNSTIALEFLQGKIEPAQKLKDIIRDIFQLIKTDPDLILAVIMKSLKVKSNRILWVKKLPEELLLKILYIIHPSDFHENFSLVSKSYLIASQIANRQETIKLSAFWYYSFEAMADYTLMPNQNDYQKIFFEHVLEDVKTQNKKEFLNEIYSELYKQMQYSERNQCLKVMSLVKKLTEESEEEVLLKHKVDKNRKAEETNKQEGSLWEEEDDAIPIYIDNAGLVITMPSIHPLFNLFGLIKDNVFIDEAAQMHGVHMIQYLVDGKTSTPEFELVLNKILCGVDIESPVPLEGNLSEKEKGVIEQIIKDMIQNWKSVSNTSVEGFRQSFLQRSGILKRREEWWELQVEEKPYDMLLDSIPWSYTTIKFAWMELPIYVKWRPEQE